MEEKNTTLKGNAQLLKDKIKALEAGTTQKQTAKNKMKNSGVNKLRNETGINLPKVNSQPLVKQTKHNYKELHKPTWADITGQTSKTTSLLTVSTSTHPKVDGHEREHKEYMN